MPLLGPAVGLWALALACSATTVQALRSLPSAKCEPEDLAAADISMRTCQMNWALANTAGHLWKRTPKFDCWALKGYNTDTYFSSTVYQNSEGRCALALSGYHIEPPEYQNFKPTGYVRGGLDLSWPPVVWNVCGFSVYAPYVRMLREHTALRNWSKLVHLVAGKHSTCTGDLLFISSSLGGAAGEVLAGCANKGLLGEVMNASLPSFKIQTIYTFGSPPAAIQPITNALRADGCFKGKRIFAHADHMSHYGFNLHHAAMDSVELWPVRRVGLRRQLTNPSLKRYRCGSADAVENIFDTGPSPESQKPFKGEYDPAQHTITSYRDELQWFHDTGRGAIFSSEVMLAPPPPPHKPDAKNHSNLNPFAPLMGR